MARGNSKTDTGTDAAQDLITKLQAATTSADLWKTAKTDDFQAVTATLSDEDLTSVRETFKALDSLLKGRVKAEDVQGVPLVIEDWDFNTSPQYPDREFCIIKGIREDNGEKFQLVSGAYKLMQFFRKLGIADKSNTPQHITIVQESATAMAARNPKPGTQPMWLVKSASVQGRKPSAGMPF